MSLAEQVIERYNAAQGKRSVPQFAFPLGATRTRVGCYLFPDGSVLRTEGRGKGFKMWRAK